MNNDQGDAIMEQMRQEHEDYSADMARLSSMLKSNALGFQDILASDEKVSYFTDY
jgi:hypothetical protein